MKDILQEITRLRMKRGWSEYELAKYSGLTQSTISTWYSKNQMPTIPSLQKICDGLGITMTQFFAEDEDLISLTKERREVLDDWSSLNFQQQKIVKDLMKNM